MNQLYYIDTHKSMGRGLFASHDLNREQFLFLAELLVLSPDDTKKAQDTDLKYYLFRFDETKDCLVLGDGELFNHSDKPNVSYKLIDYDGRRVMVFHTTRPVKAGEQLFIDYQADVKINVDEYKVNMIG